MLHHLIQYFIRYVQVIQEFYEQFYALEDEGQLDISSKVHLQALHLTYLNVINNKLLFFRNAWNEHKIRTAKNKTPYQLWISGMLNIHGSNHHLSNELFGDQIQPVADLLLSKLQELQVEVNDFAPLPHQSQSSDLQFNQEQQESINLILQEHNDKTR